MTGMRPYPLKRSGGKEAFAKFPVQNPQASREFTQTVLMAS